MVHGSSSVGIKEMNNWYSNNILYSERYMCWTLHVFYLLLKTAPTCAMQTLNQKQIIAHKNEINHQIENETIFNSR